MRPFNLEEYIGLAFAVIEEVLKNNKVALLRPPLREEYTKIILDKATKLSETITSCIFKIGESEYRKFLNFCYNKLFNKGYHNLATLLFGVFYTLERLDIIMSTLYVPDIWAYHLRQILEISAYLYHIIDESLKTHQDPILALKSIESKAKKYVKQKMRGLGKYIGMSFGDDCKKIYDDLSKYVHVKITPSRLQTFIEKFKNVEPFKDYMTARTFMSYPMEEKCIDPVIEEMKDFEKYIEKIAEALKTKFMPKLIELYERLKDKL